MTLRKIATCLPHVDRLGPILFQFLVISSSICSRLPTLHLPALYIPSTVFQEKEHPRIQSTLSLSDGDSALLLLPLRWRLRLSWCLSLPFSTLSRVLLHLPLFFAATLNLSINLSIHLIDPTPVFSFSLFFT